MGGRRAFPTFSGNSSIMTCHFTLGGGAGVENSPAKKKEAVVWVWMDFCILEPGSAPEHSPTIACAGLSRGNDVGMEKAKGEGGGKGDAEPLCESGGFLKPRQSVVTSAVWYRPLSCHRRVRTASPRARRGRRWALSEAARSDAVGVFSRPSRAARARRRMLRSEPSAHAV